MNHLRTLITACGLLSITATADAQNTLKIDSGYSCLYCNLARAIDAG